MSNVVPLNAFRKRQSPGGRLARHLSCFATARRGTEDVFWLKENAELLNILASTHSAVRSVDLDPYGQVYEDMAENIGFFPQYYRFWLSICLDLEDLGLPGDQGEALCHWVARQGLAEAELSDLQRAEAARLLARRGGARPDAGLQDRLIAFMSRPETFAVPNKKAAYELTHILFYLSDYGAHIPDLPKAVETSLDYAGTLAFLEQNFDLLAEICIARAYAGLPRNRIWDQAVQRALAGFSAGSCAAGPIEDAYHCYFVTSWWAAMAGGMPFTCEPGEGGAWFAAPTPIARPLSELSAQMRHCAADCRTGWHSVRPMIESRMSEQSWELLRDAQAAADDWDGFFERFARSAAPVVEPARWAL